MNPILRFVCALAFLGIPAGMDSHAITHPVKEQALPMVQLHTGDLVLRSGTGLISRIFRNTSCTDRTYSHAGLVIMIQGRPFVAHCIDEPNQSGSSIRIETFKKFCQRENWAVYHYASLENREQQLVTFVRSAIRMHVTFDTAFDLESDDAWYCTEFVYKAMLRIGGIQLPLSHYGFKPYVGLDNLYLNPNARLVCSSTPSI